MLSGDDPLRRVLAVLGVSALLLLPGLWLADLQPVLPTSFLLYVALLIPIVWIAHWALCMVDRRIPSRVRSSVGLGLSLLLLMLFSVSGRVAMVLNALALWAFLTVLFARKPSPDVVTVFLGVLGIVMGNVAVWSANYMALALVRSRMADPVMKAVDVWMYQTAFGEAVSYKRLFPLLNSPALLSLLESSYLMFFPEIVFVVFVLGRDRRRVAEYLARMFACYAVAIAVFLLIPVAGPYLAYADSVRPELRGSVAQLVMDACRAEFIAIRAGIQPVSGFGNFVAFPSIHIALAVVFQQSMTRDQVVFWVFLPINLMLAVATVALGYHYVVDLAAGAALGAAAVRYIRVPERQAVTTGFAAVT